MTINLCTITRILYVILLSSAGKRKFQIPTHNVSIFQGHMVMVSTSPLHYETVAYFIGKSL